MLIKKLLIIVIIVIGLSIFTQIWCSDQFNDILNNIEQEFCIIVALLFLITIFISLFMLIWNKSLRKRIEFQTHEIEESEKLRSALIENSPIGISVRDKNGTLIIANEAWKNVWAISSENYAKDVSKRTELSFDSRDDYLDKHLKNIKKIYEIGGEYYIPEIKLHKPKKGKAEWISQRFYALSDETGKIDKVVILTEDISERKKTEENLRKRNLILNSVGFVAEILLKTENMEKGLNESLNRVGEATKVSRISIYENGFDQKDELLLNKKNEWIAAGIEEKINTGSIESISYHEISESFAETLSQNQIFFGNTADFKENEKTFFSSRGILSTAIFPIFVDNHWWGIIEFDECRQEKIWSSPEIEALKIASDTVGASIQSEKALLLRSILFKISNAANVTENPDELFNYIREILNEIIDTKNIYVALYDQESDTISLPFEIDEYDTFPTYPGGKTLTSYVIKTGKSLLVDEKKNDELIRSGKVEMVGAPSKIWLGVPLKIGAETIGVLAVQSYTDPNLYTVKDLEILEFVSGQIAKTIQRKNVVSQIEQSLQEKEVLLKEVHHRVKNNMQLISSLLNLQSRYIKDKDDLKLFRESQSRVRSMSLIHEKLYQTKDFSKIEFSQYIQILISRLFGTFNVSESDISLNFDMNDVFLNINQAIPCGLIVNEILSNSIKHAFPDNIKGKISIRLELIEDNIISLIIKDNGVGIPAEFDYENPKSLGLQLVNSLIDQLHGSLELCRKKGTEFRIKFEQ